ncbi:hypothetical protein Tco_1061478 [Tanacetum coccineum]
MPIWKDALYICSLLLFKDVGNGEPKSVVDDQKQDGDGPDNENAEQDKSDDVSNPKEVNAAGQHVNTASLDVNTSSSKLNTVDPSVNTDSSYDQYSLKDMFTMGASHTLEPTHVEFFSDEDEPEVNFGEHHKFLYSGSNAGRTSAIQTPIGLDTCGFAYWKEGHWNKMGLQKQER